ncbi:MAG: RsbRD N-terminal domain-containing protein [Desulfobacterales bacterium]|nr:RsbRD N-terminal domain-containing protein [Desulfobacterales bacterium]MDJ0889154.1 RsbRD N-terminal domain-containing protein [Desulfobacterales bacterium]
MRLEKHFRKHKKQILTQWFEVLTGTYPKDTARFLKANPDTFTNPIGGTARRSLETLVDALLHDAPPEELTPLLDPLIRIRAVQTMFTPSQATAFILDLKPILRTCLANKIKEPQDLRELQALEQRIDRLLLIAFDIFVRCREKIYHLKATEEQSKIYRAFARAGLVRENDENQPDTGILK